MKLGSASKVLAGAVLALLMSGGVAWAAPNYQQKSRQQLQSEMGYAENGYSARSHPRHEQQKSQQGKQSKGQQQNLYPNATRKSPKVPSISKRDADQINKGLAAVNANNPSEAKKILQPYANGKASDNEYLQALALQGLANVNYRAGNTQQAIAQLQKALATNALPNNPHFQLMYELAQFYYTTKDYQKALDTLHQWRKEGRRETAASYGLEGILDYQLKDFEGAIKAITKAKSMTSKPNNTWDQVLAVSYAETGKGDQAIAMAKKQLAANPNDAGMRHNLISLLLSAGKNAEALKQMEKARSMGELKTRASYENLAKVYLQTGQNSDKDPRPYADKALAVLKEGVSKGIIKPDYDYYKLLGAANLIGGYTKAALSAYTKAAPLGKDGSAELSRAQLLANANKYTAARNAARKALSKGTDHKGEAYMLIAKSERALNNKKAAIVAMKKAAKYPATRSAAQAWLKQVDR